MLNHLQNVKSKRADIPNPEIPVRIQIALDKANEIRHGIASISLNSISFFELPLYD